MNNLSAREDSETVVAPWGLSANADERTHDRAILNSLRKSSYRRVFEAGCGVGSLTEQLAPACRRLIATDIAPSAVARARVRCGHFPHVSIRCADLSEHLPDGPLDLIVLQDVAHPMSAAEILRISLELSERLSPGGELISLHGNTRRIASPMTGDSIHDLLCANLPLVRNVSQCGIAFRLNSWVKR